MSVDPEKENGSRRKGRCVALGGRNGSALPAEPALESTAPAEALARALQAQEEEEAGGGCCSWCLLATASALPV